MVYDSLFEYVKVSLGSWELAEKFLVRRAQRFGIPLVTRYVVMMSTSSVAEKQVLGKGVDLCEMGTFELVLSEV